MSHRSRLLYRHGLVRFWALYCKAYLPVAVPASSELHLRSVLWFVCDGYFRLCHSDFSAHASIRSVTPIVFVITIRLPSHITSR